MRNGYRVYDADTHAHPSVETLEPFFDATLRARMPEFEPFKQPLKLLIDGEIREDPTQHEYNFEKIGGWGGSGGGPRYLGEAGPRPAGGPRRWQKFMGQRLPTKGGFEDAHVRLKDMDEEGV